MEKKQDRRIRHTKALIREALIELLGEQHISRISVTAICERADIHRSTFYAHYRDQYDLVSQLEQHILDNIKSQIEDPGFELEHTIPEQRLAFALDAMKANRELVLALVSENSGSDIQQRILELSSTQPFTVNLIDDPVVRNYVLAFSVSGCSSLCRKWLENGAREPSITIARLVMALTRYGHFSFAL